MSNPWLKKNPFMSMWLSAANSAANKAAGTARGQASAQVKRAGRTAATQATQDMMALWTAPFKTTAQRKKRR